jgi:hypothetical protein
MGVIWVLTWNNHLSIKGDSVVHTPMEVITVQNRKKAAIIVGLAMMISIVPAFAFNNTTNDTTDNQTTGETNQNQYCQDKENAGSGNCNGNCDEEQHKYMYGQKNGNTNNGNENCNNNCDEEQHKYMYGQKNGNTNNCNENCNSNCKTTS